VARDRHGSTGFGALGARAVMCPNEVATPKLMLRKSVDDAVRFCPVQHGTAVAVPVCSWAGHKPDAHVGSLSLHVEHTNRAISPWSCQ